MKLIITDDSLSLTETNKIVKVVGAKYDIAIEEGLPFQKLKEELSNIKEYDCAHITCDERALLVMPELIEIDDIYIYKNKIIKPIRECTNKELRNAHNLFKMYLAGAFEV